MLCAQIHRILHLLRCLNNDHRDAKWNYKINSRDESDFGTPGIALEATPDILAGLGASKRAGQVLVGFAAETENLVANAQAKLQRKNVDLIVANNVADAGVGFGHETNAVTLVSNGA